MPTEKHKKPDYSIGNVTLSMDGKQESRVHGTVRVHRRTRQGHGGLEVTVTVRNEGYFKSRRSTWRNSGTVRSRHRSHISNTEPSSSYNGLEQRYSCEFVITQVSICFFDGSKMAIRWSPQPGRS